VSSDSPIVEEVRRRRRELSARFEDDVREYVDHLRKIEMKHQSRVVDQVAVIRSSNPPMANQKRP